MLNIFSRNLWQAWCFIRWYCCGECLCWEQEQVCILSCIFVCKMMQRLDIKLYFYFFIFYFLIRYNNFIYTRYFHQSFPFSQHQALGNNPTNSAVIPQSLMFEFCFHQWKYFFYILQGFLCSLTTDLLSICQSRNFTMFTTQVSSVLGCRIFNIKTTTAAG